MRPKKPKLKSAWFFKSLFLLMLIGSVLGTAIIGVIFWHFSSGLPEIISPADYRPLTVTQIIATGAKEPMVIGEFFKERRYLIPFEKIPKVAVHAFIAAEDDRFFEHQGINLASMLRASVANFKAGHVVQGGSTITQQVAKSLLLTPERSWDRKIKEVILAARIEKNLTKPQILYLYLNQIYLGHGSYGIQAAAKVYFHKEADQLSLAEAALLAGMPQAPGKYSPHLNPKRAKERQLYVLRRMNENKFITQSEMTSAAAQPLRVFQDNDFNQRNCSYYVEHIRRHLAEKYGEKMLYEEGLSVTAQISPQLCKVAKKSLQEGLRAIDKRGGYRGPVQHLKDVEEIEKVLKVERIALIEKKLGYRIFQPDGRIDSIAALQDGGIDSEVKLLDQDEVYQAVVTRVDDSKKTVAVMIGGVRAELPMEKMKWAKPVRDEKKINQDRSEPTLPSRVVSKGDVIWVRVVQAGVDRVIVALEQEPIVQGALFSLDVRTGDVLAMEGGYDYDQSEFNRTIQALRQPGSAFKPVIYSAALEKGYTPTSMIQDSPIVYDDAENGKWKPNNFEEKFYGDTTFRQALIKSRNVPTIKIAQAIQVSFLIDYAKRLGMSAQFAADLSISLGSMGVSLLELTRIYSIFPRLGRKVTPTFISKVRDRDGKILEEKEASPLPLPMPAASVPVAESSGVPDPNLPRPAIVFPAYPLAGDSEQVMDPRVAYVMTHLMKEVITYGTGHEAKSLGRVAAGKTGTTSDYIDAWFMGFTPYVVTGVWVGFDNQRAIGPLETGARAALPIWLSFMKEAVRPYPDTDFAIPPGVVFANINPTTGRLAASNSSTAIKEAFIEGTEPLQSMGAGDKATETPTEFLKEDIE